jgi:BlaI family transcriptional regulator, penicillinase repressor
MKSLRLGRVQMKIMQALWAGEGLSARQITEELNRSEPIAHSTVQTLLRKLEAKGAVRHESHERTFVFYPVVKEDRAKWSAVCDVMDRVFDGSAVEMVSCLFEKERLSAEEMEQIRRLIDKQKGKRG